MVLSFSSRSSPRPYSTQTRIKTRMLFFVFPSAFRTPRPYSTQTRIKTAVAKIGWFRYCSQAIVYDFWGAECRWFRHFKTIDKSLRLLFELNSNAINEEILSEWRTSTMVHTSMEKSFSKIVSWVSREIKVFCPKLPKMKDNYSIQFVIFVS